MAPMTDMMDEQDKENRHSPANAPAEPPSATTPITASLAFLTPARLSEASQDTLGSYSQVSTAGKEKASQPSTSMSTHTAFAANTPRIDDATSSAAARAAGHAETGHQHRARTRLGNPAFSTPAIPQPDDEHMATPYEAEQVLQVSTTAMPVITPFCNLSGHICFAIQQLQWFKMLQAGFTKSCNFW